MVKFYNRFQTKMVENPYPLVRHIPIKLGQAYNGQILHQISDKNGSETIPFGAAHTYIASLNTQKNIQYSLCRLIMVKFRTKMVQKPYPFGKYVPKTIPLGTPQYDMPI